MVNQLLAFRPSQTGVCNGFSVDSLPDFLVSRLDIALHHDAFDQLVNVFGNLSVMEDFGDDAGLFGIAFVGVGMVGIHDACRVFEIQLAVHLAEANHVFIVIVRLALAVLVYCAPQDGVGEGVAVSLDLPSTVHEGVASLGGDAGIEHDAVRAAGGVLHAAGDIDAADGQAVLLVLYGAGTHCHVGQDIGNVGPVFRIEHFVCREEMGFRDGAQMHLSHGDEALGQIRGFFGVRLVYDAFVALPGGSGLIGIDAGDDDNLILHLFLHLCQSADVVADRIFVVRGTGTDND